MTLFDGVCVAMITPFCGDDLDFDCLDRLVNKYLNAGIDAICVCGTTGEPNTITTEERGFFILFRPRARFGKNSVYRGGRVQRYVGNDKVRSRCRRIRRGRTACGYAVL